MHIVKSVGVMSVAKIMGTIHACLGLLVAPMFLLLGVIGSMAPHPQNQPFPAFFGVGMAVIAPIFYGVFGFIFGAIGALLYNLFARWIGGFELELEPKSNIPTAPYPIIPATPQI